MKKLFVFLSLIGLGLTGSAHAKETKVDCRNFLSSDQFLAAIGESGSAKYVGKHGNTACNYLNEAGTRNVGWSVTELASDEEWTRTREALKMVAGYGVTIVTDVPGVGADAYAQGPIMFFLSSDRKHKVSVFYAEKPSTSPQETQAAIRKQIALEVDKAVTKGGAP